jgi:hypothetical protein
MNKKNTYKFSRMKKGVETMQLDPSAHISPYILTTNGSCADWVSDFNIFLYYILTMNVIPHKIHKPKE